MKFDGMYIVFIGHAHCFFLHILVVQWSTSHWMFVICIKRMNVLFLEIGDMSSIYNSPVLQDAGVRKVNLRDLIFNAFAISRVDLPKMAIKAPTGGPSSSGACTGSETVELSAVGSASVEARSTGFAVGADVDANVDAGAEASVGAASSTVRLTPKTQTH